jgi:hypothetical protein
VLEVAHHRLDTGTCIFMFISSNLIGVVLSTGGDISFNSGVFLNLKDFLCQSFGGAHRSSGVYMFIEASLYGKTY